MTCSNLQHRENHIIDKAGMVKPEPGILGTLTIPGGSIADFGAETIRIGLNDVLAPCTVDFAT